MKKKITPFEYIAYLLTEAALFMSFFKLIIYFIDKSNVKMDIHSILLISVIVLGVLYLIIKIISQIFSEKTLLAMLPISYQLGIYTVQFLMVLDNSSKSVDYSNQLGLLTLFFITVSVIDKVIKLYLKEE